MFITIENIKDLSKFPRGVKVYFFQIIKRNIMYEYPMLSIFEIIYYNKIMNKSKDIKYSNNTFNYTYTLNILLLDWIVVMMFITPYPKLYTRYICIFR